MKQKPKKKPARPSMPLRLPDDPVAVTMLLDESERMTDMGNRWNAAKKPNHLAANFCLQNGWAFALAAAWLRCKLNGALEATKD